MAESKFSMSGFEKGTVGSNRGNGRRPSETLEGKGRLRPGGVDAKKRGNRRVNYRRASASSWAAPKSDTQHSSGVWKW